MEMGYSGESYSYHTLIQEHEKQKRYDGRLTAKAEQDLIIAVWNLWSDM